MGGYPLNAFGPSPYGPYGNPLMAAQMNQMGQLGGFGFGNFGPYAAAGGFSPQVQSNMHIGRSMTVAYPKIGMAQSVTAA